MSNKATKYTALIDGLLAVAARDLCAQEYAELRGGLSARGWDSDECPSSTRENPCTFPRWHHGPHSWEKEPDADALAGHYRRTRPEGVGKVTVGEALAAMREQGASPPACGFRSLREEASVAQKPCPYAALGCHPKTPCISCGKDNAYTALTARAMAAYRDAEAGTGPMCKATRSAWPRTPVDICWREEGHREDHDFRPGVMQATDRPFEAATMEQANVRRCVWRFCDENGRDAGQCTRHYAHDGDHAVAKTGGDVRHVCTIRCTGLGAIQCPKAGV